MAQIFVKKRSDGQQKAVEGTDQYFCSIGGAGK